jgi:hypothetical protein
MKQPNVLWQSNSEPQRAFLRSTARHCLLGGGNASGKTSALLAAAAMQTGNSRHRAVIFRKDYPSCKHIISSSYPLFLPMRASYNKSEHCWYWPSGSTLEFSHLEDEAAVFQHAGKQYSFIGFDELTQLPGDVVDSRGNPINSAFGFMQTRLRADADSGLALECRATASPGGPGMGWVKAFYQIPESGESSEFVHPVTGYRHQYVRALASVRYQRLADAKGVTVLVTGQLAKREIHAASSGSLIRFGKFVSDHLWSSLLTPTPRTTFAWPAASVALLVAFIICVRLHASRSFFAASFLPRLRGEFSCYGLGHVRR